MGDSLSLSTNIASVVLPTGPSTLLEVRVAREIHSQNHAGDGGAGSILCRA